MAFIKQYETDGVTVYTETKTVQIAKGITVRYYRDTGEVFPHEVTLIIGNAEVEMAYSMDTEIMLDNIADYSAAELLALLTKQQRGLVAV